jgi:crotonobetainyl-CoA:carnitine CoA-transferase CaiB-like acyl-CoA transferase
MTGGAPDAAESALPLRGITALEFTHTVMGPSAGLFLADLGADVIRIEPLDGDRTRRLKGSGRGYFYFYNRNKRSLAIDIKNPKSRPALDTLIRRADVLIENMGVGTMDRLGLGYADTAALNPRLIYCALKGFLSGPYEARAGLDEVVQMMSGLAYMTGLPGKPLRVGASVIDVMGGLFGAYGVLAALRERDRTGRGSLVRSALFETAVFLMGQHMVQSALQGEPLQPMSVRTSAWAVYDIFATADDKSIFLGIISDAHWQRFCHEFGRVDWAQDPALATNNQRIVARDRLMPELKAMLGALDLDTAARRAEAANLPFAPVRRPEDLFDDRHLMESGQLAESRAEGRTVRVPAQPFQIDGTRFTRRVDPAEIDGDGEAILRDCGLTEAEIAGLANAGVIRPRVG